jgi:hypothetical protein
MVKFEVKGQYTGHCLSYSDSYAAEKIYNCDSKGCNDSVYELRHYEPNIVTKSQGGAEHSTYSTTKEG